MPHHVPLYVSSRHLMNSIDIHAQMLADILTASYKRYNKSLGELATIDSLRTYNVLDRGEYLVISYRDGTDAGMPKFHCFIHKNTGHVYKPFITERGPSNYTLLEEYSRKACLYRAEHTGKYLDTPFYNYV